jgi:flavin reductase (DIM6/NTAB) family NADH-FMN oxidoreductase RutF
MKHRLPLDKHAWHPSPLPGQIVLVSTVDGDGTPNLAPKSWVTMVAFAGPIVAFGCNVGHTTYRNIAATGEFVVNVLPVSLAERAWELSDVHGDERRRTCGLTLVPAEQVRAPLVDECTGHLECVLDGLREYGDEVMIFGRVVAASVEDGYERLAPAFFLESGVYAGLGSPVRR